jgi:hypothetical protein
VHEIVFQGLDDITHGFFFDLFVLGAGDADQVPLVLKELL